MIYFVEILTLLDTFISSNEYKVTLINELIYECQRLYPSFESRLIQYKINFVNDSSLREDEPSSSSFSIIDDYKWYTVYFFLLCQIASLIFIMD